MKHVLLYTVIFLLFSMSVIATDLSDCGTIDSSGNYVLTQNISNVEGCIDITASDVVLDCNGYSILWNSDDTNPSDDGVFVDTGYTNITIKNCYFEQNETNSPAINLYQSDDISIIDNIFNMDASNSAQGHTIFAQENDNLIIGSNVFIVNQSGYGSGIPVYLDTVTNLLVENNDITITGTGNEFMDIADDSGMPDNIIFRGNTISMQGNVVWVLDIVNALFENEVVTCNGEYNTGQYSSCGAYALLENSYPTSGKTVIFRNITLTATSTTGGDTFYTEDYGSDNIAIVENCNVNLNCNGGDCISNAGFSLYGTNGTAIVNNSHFTGSPITHQFKAGNLYIYDSTMDSSGASEALFEEISSWYIENSIIEGTVRLTNSEVGAGGDKIMLNSTIDTFSYAELTYTNYIIEEQQWSRVYAESNLAIPVSGATITAGDVFATEQWTDTTDIAGYTEWHPTPIRTFNETTDPIITYNTYDFYGIKGTETGNELDQTVTQDYIVTIQLSETSPEPSPITGNIILGGIGTCDESNWSPFLVFAILAVIFVGIITQFIGGAKAVVTVMPILLMLFGVTIVLIWLVGC